MQQQITITKKGGTAYIYNGVSNLMIDGTDYPDDKKWRADILEEIQHQISQWAIEEEQ